MWNKDNIQEELKEVAPGLIELRHLETFTVPEFYFSSLADVILNKVNGNSQQSIFDTASAIMPYSAPAGYFDGLAAQIMLKVQASPAFKSEVDLELELIAPALVGLNKSPVYSVPVGYFENLIAPTMTKPVGKVVSMHGAGKALRYLAAAVVIAVMAFSAYLFFDKPTDTGSAKNSIEAPVNLDKLNVTAAVDKLSEEEILNYLKAYSNPQESSLNPIMIPDVNADFKEVIKDLPEEELKAFLNQYSDGNQTLLKNS